MIGTLGTIDVPEIGFSTGSNQMRICIHRGSNEIGGTCIEVESSGKRIVLDVGLPLNVDTFTDPVSLVPHVKGFTESDDDLLAIVISHPHQDHYGLVGHLRTDIPVVIGDSACRMLKVADQFTPSGLNLENTIALEDRKAISVEPFQITPYLVDHSAYDAYSMLIEANGKRLFYSGDFRAHGRKKSLFERFVAGPPKHIDVLLMEGTTIGRLSPDKTFTTESELEPEFVNYFQQTKGMAFVFTSSQNIDRLVTIFRACLKSKRQLILDLYTAEILRATGNDKLPQGTWNNIRVFLPNSQRHKVFQEKLFDEVASFKHKRIYPEQLAAEASRSVMIFRPSMCKELEKANCLQDSRIIYSLWGGYLKFERMQPFLGWLKKYDISMNHIHTSGHASVVDLKRFARAINGKKLVPIHSFNPQDYSDLFDHVEEKQDGEWWKVKTDNGGSNMSRKLSAKFISDLKKGFLKPLLEFIHNDWTLDFQIRNNEAHIYYRGGKVLGLNEKKDSYHTQFDYNYCLASNRHAAEIRCLPERISSSSDLHKWLNAIPYLKQAMDEWFVKHPKVEREYQQHVVYENNRLKTANGTDYYILDIEYANKNGRFDLIALLWPSTASVRKLSKGYKPRLAFIEKKFGDGALNGKAGVKDHLQDMKDFLNTPNAFADLRKEMALIFQQKRELGLITGLGLDEEGKNNNQVEMISDEKPEFIFLLAAHDPDSKKLINLLEKLKDTDFPSFDLKFATANFMGYGLYREAIYDMDTFLSKFSEQIST